MEGKAVRDRIVSISIESPLGISKVGIEVFFVYFALSAWDCRHGERDFSSRICGRYNAARSGGGAPTRAKRKRTTEQLAFTIYSHGSHCNRTEAPARPASTMVRPN